MFVFAALAAIADCRSKTKRDFGNRRNNIDFFCDNKYNSGKKRDVYFGISKTAAARTAEMRCSMIYFYRELIAKALEVAETAEDCEDVLRDLKRIEQATENVRQRGDVASAHQLDQELRGKYFCIDVMDDCAKALEPPGSRNDKIYTPSEAVISSLEEDRYGILCHVALKKGLVQEVRQFIQET